MARTWMKVTEHHVHFGEWDVVEMPDYYPISIYKDTTRQYIDEECDRDNCVEIPVPKDLIVQWLKDKSSWNQEVANEILEDLEKWIYSESTCDDTEDLYVWLTQHNYFWKRLD